MIHFLSQFNPRNNEIRYIGKTSSDLKKRLNGHLSKKELRDNTHKNNWIKVLISLELRLIIESIDSVPESDWQFWEKHYIRVGV